MNAIGQFRATVISGLAMAASNLALSIFFVKRFGIVGAVLGTVISLLFVQVVPLTLVTRRLLRRMAGKPSEPDATPVGAST
jgi:O-antigen/teichoic acid export membrane protein